jgi:hypothetical protein
MLLPVGSNRLFAHFVTATQILSGHITLWGLYNYLHLVNSIEKDDSRSARQTSL